MKVNMEVDLSKMDYGQGMMGYLAKSMTGDSGLKFGPEDEGVIAISTRISPRAKKIVEQFSEIGGVAQAVITRICIETGLDQLAMLLEEVKKAKDAAYDAELEEHIAGAEYDEESFVAGIVGTLTALREESSAKKKGSIIKVPKAAKK